MALSSIERDPVTTSDTPVASSSFVGAVRWCEIRAFDSEAAKTGSAEAS